MSAETENPRDKLVAALQQLGKSAERTKRARLIEIIDEVEARLATGSSKKMVVKVLEQHGLVFTYRSFETTLARIRKERKESPQVNPGHRPITLATDLAPITPHNCSVPTSPISANKAEKPRQGFNIDINSSRPPSFKRTERK